MPTCRSRCSTCSLKLLAIFLVAFCTLSFTPGIARAQSPRAFSTASLPVKISSRNCQLGGIEVEDGRLWKGDIVTFALGSGSQKPTNQLVTLCIARSSSLSSPGASSPLELSPADLAQFVHHVLPTDAEGKIKFPLSVVLPELTLFFVVPVAGPTGGLSLQFSSLLHLVVEDPARIHLELNTDPATILVHSESDGQGGYQNLSVEFLPTHAGPLAGQLLTQDPDTSWFTHWHPLAVALRYAVPGDVIDVTGDVLHPIALGLSYNKKWYNVNKADAGLEGPIGGTAEKPVTIRGRAGSDPTGKILITRKFVQTGADHNRAIEFSPATGLAPRHIHWENFVLEVGTDAAINFVYASSSSPEPAQTQLHEGLWFYDVDLAGKWTEEDFKNPGGPNPDYSYKFGLTGWNGRDIRFCGVSAPARVTGLGQHPFYFHNMFGGSGRAASIVNVVGQLSGRTFCQNRWGENGIQEPGSGILMVKDCEAHDTGLKVGDPGGGGATLTTEGYAGWTLYERVLVRQGFNPLLAGQVDGGGIGFDTKGYGALVIWDKTGNGPDAPVRNGVLHVRRCDFESKAGYSKWMVDLSSTDEVVIESCRIVSAPHVDRALEIDDPYNKPVPKVQYMKMSGTTLVGNLNKGGLVLGPNTAPTLQEFLDALAQGLEFPVDY